MIWGQHNTKFDVIKNKKKINTIKNLNPAVIHEVFLCASPNANHQNWWEVLGWPVKHWSLYLKKNVTFMSKSRIKTKTVLAMTDMTQSTELQAFKRPKDGYKVTVKISLCICVVLSWDELKVRQNLLESDYGIYMVRLLVATVNWHKSLQFVKKSNKTLLPCLFTILLAVSMITF